jgi:hypothetical protein
MTQYASKTDVSSVQSRADIEKVLLRYGADDFGYMSSADRAVIAFAYDGKRIRFTLPMPNRHAAEFVRTPTGRVASDTAAQSAYEQAVRQKWRALLLVTKAKLEAVESGISTFEQEFMAHIVLPSGRTVGEEIMPQVNDAIEANGPVRLSIEA